MPRTFAIGDIHGSYIALTALLDGIKPKEETTRLSFWGIMSIVAMTVKAC